MDYMKNNKSTKNNNYLVPLIAQMFDRLAYQENYCFHDWYSVYNDIFIVPKDKKEEDTHMSMWKLRIPFGLCNDQTTFNDA